MKDYIPVIDFSDFGLDKKEVAEENLQKLAKQVIDALSNVGFLYLKNHGISQEIISATEKVSDQFFTLTGQEKEKYKKDLEAFHGYDYVTKEKLNPNRPGDYKECYDVTLQNAKIWPNDEVPDFEQVLTTFHHQVDALAQRLLEVIAIGLNLPKEYFKERHNTYEKSNGSVFRLLHYPPIHDDSVIETDQIRCGEHSDYGTITLLFQDNGGGLEVFSREGQYVPATPIDGTIVVNIGDLMQRWTADKLVSTKHRVLIPEIELKKRTSRKSMAYFVKPDDDCLVTCVDGSNKYPPITSVDYSKGLFAVSYKEKEA